MSFGDTDAGEFAFIKEIRSPVLHGIQYSTLVTTPGSQFASPRVLTVTDDHRLRVESIFGATPGPPVFAEDTPHTDGDLGVLFLAVRRDGEVPALADNNDYIPLVVDSSNRLKTFATLGTGSNLAGRFIISDGVESAGVTDANQLQVSDPMLDIPRGLLSGITYVNKFGRNLDVDSTPTEDIWDLGGTWVAPTASRTHNIVSGSVLDTSGGVGARTIRIFGLTSWSSAEVSEDITMNGTTNVPTSNSYVIIHRMQVLTKGASSSNIANITATAQTDGTVTAQILSDVGQSRMAICGIPSTQVAYMTSYYCSMNRGGGSSGRINFDLLVNPEPDAELTNYLVKHTQAVDNRGSGHVQQNFAPYFRINGPAIIKMDANSGINNTDVSAGFDLVLVDN